MRAATPAEAGETKAAEQEHTKQLGINADQLVRRNNGESSASTTPTLRPHEGFLAVCQTGEHHRVSKTPTVPVV